MSVNKVILIGNVGQDPKVTFYDGGNCVAQLSFATSEKGYTLQNGTQIPDRTEWHNLVFRNRLEGKIRTRSYDDQAGVKRYVTEIFVDSMEMLSPKAAGVAPQATVQPNVQQQSIQSQVAPAQDNGADDLPF